MKNYFLLSLIVLNTILINAQIPTWEWAKTGSGSLGDYGIKISTDYSDNVYVTGLFYSSSITFGNFVLTNAGNAGNTDIFVVKYDNSGNVQWATSAGGSSDEIGLSVINDRSGNIYIGGSFASTSILIGSTTLTNAGSNNTDAFIAKYDSSGNVIWAISAGGSGQDRIMSLAIDTNGNVFATGYFGSSITFGTTTLLNSSTSPDIFVAKYDSTGSVVWAKSGGANWNEQAFSIATDGNGNAYVTGWFSGSMFTFDSITVTNAGGSCSFGCYDMFIMKLNSLGDVSWIKSVGGTDHDYGKSITTDSAGNVFVTGVFYSSSITFGSSTLTNGGGKDFFLAKLDTYGNHIWAKSVVSGADQEGTSVITDQNGNIYVTIAPGPIHVRKYDGNGNVSWIKTVISSYWDTASGVAIDSEKNVYITGNFEAPTLTFSPSITIINGGNYDVFTAKLSQCNLIANITSTPTNFNSPNCNGSVAINPTGGTPPYNISWSSGTTTNLCEDWYTATVTDANNCAMTDSVYVSLVIGIEELNAAGISIYPNPVNGKITINSEKEIGEIKIYDVVGKLIYQEVIKNNIAEINVKELNAGIYFIGIKTHRIKIVKK